MSFGISVVKLIIFTFNLVITLGGLALIVLGALVQAKMSFVTDVLKENKLTIPAIVLIVLGSCIFIIAFLGCCGAAKESHCLLISYAVILCSIFIVEIVIASLAFVYRKDLEKVYDDAMHELYDNEKENQQVIDSVQQTFHCCGLTGPGLNLKLPSSCCENTVATCTIVNAYKTGCYGKVKDFIQWSGNVLGGVAIGVAVVELIGIIFSCCMANEVKNLERRRGIA